MSLHETLKAISRWKIDAIQDNNPDAVFLREERIDSFVESPPSFVIGKKGTGKTAFATKLRARFPDNMFHVTFGEIYPTYLEIQRHQKNSDIATKQVAIQLAACLAALDQWSRQTRRSLTRKQWQTIFDRVQRPAFLPAAIAAVATLLIKTKVTPDGNEVSELKVDFSRIKFHLNTAQMMRDYVAKILKSVQRSKADVFLFVDGIDDLECFSQSPFSKEADELLRAFIYATYTWDQSNDRPLKLIAMVRPEFLDLARLPNLKGKIEDDSLLLEWDEESLVGMLQHRLEAEAAATKMRTAERGGYSRRIGPYELFGRSDQEHRAIVTRLFSYSFLRPRDVVRYTKFVADYALRSANPHQALPIEYFDKVLEKQRAYLLDEMKAELAVTLPDYYRFIQALLQLNASNEERLFIKRDTFEAEMEAAVLAAGSDLEVREITNRLYNAFAIGYRGAGNSRHFCFDRGLANFPDGNQVVLHDLFREIPNERLLLQFGDGGSSPGLD